MPSMPVQPDLFAEFLYRDARAGIAFLERGFGFEPVNIYPNDDGSVAHAELRMGRGYVMTSTWTQTKYGYVVPRDIDNVNTGSLYIGMPEVDGVYRRAKAAGAEIVQDLLDTDYGSRGFSARDPEGVLWHFGTYRPTVDGGDPYVLPDSDVYTGHRYENARAAIAWLARAFDFQEMEVYADGDQVAHAQLRFGSSVFMTGSARDDAYRMRTPRQLGGRSTHVICGYANDPDAHCARAREAGAEIIDEPEDKPYGARIYVARDPEGYVWSFGTYRPATEPVKENVSAGGA
jgi:uncharacterized glyoxalase superfamily protein PhnB